ncbi:MULTISPECIES: histidine utilization repressor [Vibrio]|uniref:histidine utilization repressor n=1 Tax=Vibrio TaxID=662 RepID=UPI001EFCB2FC|nr:MULTISPECIES: histidine utilization repressor [Vibrio]MCG9679110.1 histidine utilization repressor [Vibrio sp. Isolate24]USD33822.1 histidine utilization repressor [Vibrio sp. SCSIO 43186]USD46922.1 histidine utilization repressor [Vibrio sp. SCSIO 43145]USD70946.1 histidine utilization repressor [Vibrio sp. SCSIO 43139]USD95851.1 histidine utilization repressor [Vibrio coralliilyticus]
MSQSPLYLQIKQYITDKIDSGYWPVGHRISTELELTEQFEVSRMTVNKAIRDLVAEGKLQRRPRLGTFVCAPDDKAESPLLDIQNIAEEVKLRGKTYSSKVIKQASMLADETVAIKLGVMLNSPIFYSEIIHFEDNSPIQYELRWVNSTYAPDYLEQDFTQITPNQYLSENCPLSAIEHTVEAIVADDEVRNALRLGANEPCLLLNRRTWSQDKLVSSALLYHPGTRYKLSSKILLS